MRDWPEIWKSEIPLFEFCPISQDWGDLGLPNLARTFLIKSYRMLQNARVIAFTVSELLRENRQEVKFPHPHLPTRIRLTVAVPRGGGGTLCPRGQSLHRWGLTDKAMNLKFYDFSSNSIWNKGPTKKILLVRYILRTGPFVGDGWNSSVIGDVPTRSWFL